MGHDHDWKFIGWDPSSISGKPSAISTIGRSHFQCVRCGAKTVAGRTGKNHRVPPTSDELRSRHDPNAELFGDPVDPACGGTAVQEVGS